MASPGQGPGILCCVVARGTTILAKYTSVAGNIAEVSDRTNQNTTELTNQN